jgi:putative endonuclease
VNGAARASGAAWEDVALDRLRGAGLDLVARNFHCRFGEIDLVMRERGGDAALVFVEVRYRADAAHGDGTASVGTAKQGKLVRAARTFLDAHPQFAALPCRFDVVGLSGSSARPIFDWTRAAFDADT